MSCKAFANARPPYLSDSDVTDLSTPAAFPPLSLEIANSTSAIEKSSTFTGRLCEDAAGVAAYAELAVGMPLFSRSLK